MKIDYYNEGWDDAINAVDKVLDLCKVCGGSHGKWLDRDEIARKLKEMKPSYKTGRKDGS